MTMAPLIVNGKVMVGVSGGEFGVRGFIAAYDAESGKQDGRPTRSRSRRARPRHLGGRHLAARRRLGVDDRHLRSRSNLTYWGTGNASPWFGDQRPGDNLYTSSTVAIDPDTGALKGHFQYHWNDSWDWDEMNAPMVVDYEKDGQTVKGLIKPSRNGYLYWLERSPDGPIGYVNATNYVKQDVFASIDAKTGRPTYNEDRKAWHRQVRRVLPVAVGRQGLAVRGLQPEHRHDLHPGQRQPLRPLEGKVQEYVAGQWWTGVAIPDIGFTIDLNADHYGELQAWNVNTGERVWNREHPTSMNWGSVLTTAGSLVFMGGTNDRMFRAFDAEHGAVLWKFKTNSGIMAPPSSLEVNGVQYIAVQSGWGVDPAFQQGLINNIRGEQVDVPQGGVIWVFALPQQ